MIAPASMFVFALSLFFAAMLLAAVPALRRARRVAHTADVDLLLKRLVEVDRDSLARVAEGHRNPEACAIELDPSEIWSLAGGMRGVEALAANCQVLIDLACYVQQWYPEALVVAEQLRLEAREIQWHVERLQGAQRRGNLQTAFPDYAQRAAVIYYGMTLHVVALFEMSAAPGLSRLRAAL